MKYLLEFEMPLAAVIEHSGGKGANLSLLTQRGFPVPPGFIVTAAAYRDFIRGASDFLRGARDLPVNDPPALRARSEQLRAALGQLSLPPGLDEEVRQQLRKYPEPQTFSVRSSSTMEDLASAAFAGQHDTYLNCAGAGQILEKIKACFISLWQHRAIAYRQQQGFDHLLAAMAVVVQQMVPSEVAGVGFSINPVSGDLGELVINANFGLGESVVSGEGEIDQFLVDKATRKVRSATVARKSRQIVGVAGGTREIAVAEADAARPSLTDDQLAQLAALLVRVEESYRFPQDIEWAFAGGQLHLLQSRPVTTIPPRWTRDESAERFPNVITPLTWDFVESGFHRSLNYSFRLMGFPPFNGKWFGMHDHYIYGNQNAVELYGRRTPVAVRSVAELEAVIPRLRDEFRWVQELPVLWSRELDYYLVRLGEFMAEPLDAKDLAGVWAYVLAINEHGAQYFLPNIAISITQSTLYRLLHGLLRMVVGEQAAAQLFDGLMAFCETKTGTINKELFAMALEIRALPELERLLNETPSRELVDRGDLGKFPGFKTRLGKFLRDHGHREVDFDACQPTWLEIPWVVLDNLRLILQTPMDRTPAQKERELKVRMQQAEFELFSRLPTNLHFFFYEILRLCRTYTSLDDLEHYQTTRLTLPLRRGLREVGRRLVDRAVLDEPMDIFFANRKQIDEAIAADDPARWREFSAAVRSQKQAYRRDQERKPEWILGERRDDEAATADFLTGLPGSPGQAEGPVFLVLSSDDFARFPKGAVLVARTTNPTWTPLFYSAAAVVTESGGPLSHGAVTAREMRIPAVMSVKQSLARLKNGQRVRVDGSQGKVYLV
ncbi:MAG: PEP/pyruvate-binding domain-containing protein [Limisphaerales bacterium]